MRLSTSGFCIKACPVTDARYRAAGETNITIIPYNVITVVRLCDPDNYATNFSRTLSIPNALNCVHVLKIDGLAVVEYDVPLLDALRSRIKE